MPIGFQHNKVSFDALALAWSQPLMPGLLAALLGLAHLALDAGEDADTFPLRFVAQHPASSQQQRQRATQLLAALGQWSRMTALEI